MKKLKLNIDDLKVESFETSNIFSENYGTVKGFECNGVNSSGGPSHDETCPFSCRNSCQNSCGGSCGPTCNGDTCGSCDPTCGISCDCYTWPDPAICTD